MKIIPHRYIGQSEINIISKWESRAYDLGLHITPMWDVIYKLTYYNQFEKLIVWLDHQFINREYDFVGFFKHCRDFGDDESIINAFEASILFDSLNYAHNINVETYLVLEGWWNSCQTKEVLDILSILSWMDNCDEIVEEIKSRGEFDRVLEVYENSHSFDVDFGEYLERKYLISTDVLMKRFRNAI